MKEKEQLTMNNWEDWFNNCNVLEKKLTKHEGLLKKYYFCQYSKKQDEELSAAFYSRHNNDFYKDDTILPVWKILRAFKLAFFIAFGLVLLYALIITFLINTVMKYGFNESLSFAYILPLLKHYGLIFLGVYGIVTTIICGIGILRRFYYIKRIQSIQKNMQDSIKYIPPKYRNAESMNFFYETHKMSNGGIIGNLMFEQCDDYLEENNLTGYYLSVMFDEPYQQLDFIDAGSRKKYNITNPALLEDENLPSDIINKTFYGTENAESELKKMIGMDSIKQQLRKLKSRMDFYGEGARVRGSGNNMVFLGQPGTGKSTVARIVTKILYDYGYISENKIVEVEGSYLKSPYQGQASARVTSIANYANGGVLFIDEAYTLADSSDELGKEIIGILLKIMEDMNNSLVVIFAGYEDDMNRFLASNQGFNSRVKYKLYFDDFATEDLMKIFNSMLSQVSDNQEYTLSKKGAKLLEQQFDKEKELPMFGNARTVRNALDAILDAHAINYQNGKLSEENKYTITEEDVLSYIETRKKQLKDDKRNYMATHNLDNSIISFNELKDKTKDGSKNPDKDLAGLIGLEKLKEEVEQLKAQFEFYEGNIKNEGNHMCFVGPPGTGKTTVAKIITGYLYNFGLISDNKYIDINGDFLRGSYVGHTGKRTEAVVQYAQGQVLFVDEAYLLQNSKSNDGFGAEAVGVLLDAMEKNRQNFVVIFAGYEREMEEFFETNSGLKSRIKSFFHFEPYTEKELAKILQRVATAQKFKIEKECWMPLLKYFNVKKKEKYFGNGRFARSLFEDIKKKHIVNYSSGKIPKEKKYTITIEDLKGVLN